ncbi:hypothetical protein TSUD_31090 [Trifolium subterraneum]|uniref:Uncharacterized protein n=1 Tax=Trifolium subterraneum TaxID=3900 RepID=A0A2Z6MQF4_TRISU|nr:hypothetical protein TSUD_31090 [Trifolium subterraneum]
MKLGLCLWDLLDNPKKGVLSVLGFRPSPKQEPRKSSCSGTRMMTLDGRSSGTQMDVTWMDKPFRFLLPRVKAIQIALKCPFRRFESRGRVMTVGSSRLFVSAMIAFGPLDPYKSWPLDQSDGLHSGGIPLLHAGMPLSVFSTSPNFSAFHSSSFLKFLKQKLLSPSLNTTFAISTIWLLDLANYVGHSYECASIHMNLPSINEFAWVADEPRTTVWKFSITGGGIFKTVQHPPLEDWKACVPSMNRRICSKFQWGSFPMYQIAFEHMRYRLPFSDFEVAVFRHLHLTHSQLHPNSLAFIRAFEMTSVYLGFMPTNPLFFHAFHLQRSKPKGEVDNKYGWVSLKQKVKLFEMFLESVRDATGAPLMGPDGRPVMDDYNHFPLSWMRSHYLRPASDFVYSTEELSVEELLNYEQLKVFVSGFPRKYHEDKEENLVLDELGAPVTKKAFIDKKKLPACKNNAEMEACFQEMSTIVAKLRKSKLNKEKRQNAALGSTSTAAAPPPPGGDVVERSSHIVVDLEDSGREAEHQSRPTKVARVDEVDASARGRIPATSSRFVLHPAIGSPGLVKKSSIAFSDAEKAIMDDMGPEALKNKLTDVMVAAFKLMEISSFLNGREFKYLEERDAAREEVIAANQRLEQAKINHAAYRDKHKLQADLLTKLDEKEAEAAQLTTEKEKLEGQVKDLVTEKETLEGKVKELKSRPSPSTTAPDPEGLVVDPNGEYKGFTRAAMVSRIFELEAQQVDIAKSSFDNAVAQLLVPNP